jgi:hypothetical protein
MAKSKFIEQSSKNSSENDDVIERIRLLEQCAIDIAEGANHELDEKFYYKSETCVFDLE